MLRQDAASKPFSSIAERIQAIAQDNPSRIAVEAYPSGGISYAALDRLSGRIASRLIERGAGPGSLVGACVDRSIDLVPALLGILKTGAAYLPLDHTYPKDRLDFMLRDSGATLALTGGGVLREVPTAVTLLEVDELLLCQTGCPEIRIAPSSLAYVIYTSGSTGRPKGVEITHGAVMNLLDSFAITPGMSSSDRVLAITTLSFDIAVIEIWLPLVLGATIVLATRGTARDGAALAELIAERGVTVVQATPATWRLLLDAGWREGAGIKALCGGEPLTRELANAIQFTGADLWNVYGPTETTVWSSVAHVTSQDGPIPIGGPIANTDMWVVDNSGCPAPPGTVGELHIGGAGLARGYRNDPETTARKFIPHPFDPTPDTRLYRTGDLARQRPDGQFECLGRLDDQLKIDGYRVEPGEIEAVLSAQPGVQQAIVAASADAEGDLRLVAYIVHGDAREPEVPDLQAEARRQLPSHLVPSTFVFLRTAPLTPNGKLDRKALPAPSSIQPVRASRSPAVTDIEAKLATIWCDVLELPEVGRDDNFFDIGGRSRLGARVFARIEAEMGLRLPLATLFDAPTIAQLASVVAAQSTPRSWPCLVPIQTTGSYPPFYCVHPVGGNVVSYHILARHLGKDIPFYGLQAAGLDGLRRRIASVEEMAAEYIREIRILQPQGPYHLGGASFGGLVAFEMAVQLHRAGEPVGLLALLDTDFPAVPSSPVFRMVARAAIFRRRLYPALVRVRGHIKSVRKLGFARYGGVVRQTIDGRETAAALGAFMHTLADVEAANLRAMSKYVPSQYRGTLQYFRAADEVPSPDRRHRWREQVDAIHVHDIPGGHFSMRREPHVRVLATRLREQIVRQGRTIETVSARSRSAPQPPFPHTPAQAQTPRVASPSRPEGGADTESGRLRV